MSLLLPALLAGGAVALLLSPGQGAQRVRAVARAAGTAPRGPALSAPAPTGRVLSGSLPGTSLPGPLGLAPGVAAPLVAAALALVVGAGLVVAALAAAGTASAARWWSARSAAAQREHERARAVEACAALAAELRAGRSPAQALTVAAGRATGASGRALASAAAAAELGGDVAAVLLSACGGPASTGPAGHRHDPHLPEGRTAHRDSPARDSPARDSPARDSRTAVAPVLRALAACWTVCAGTGSGLAAAVERLEEGLRADAGQRRALQAELAGPRATAGMLALLPLAGLLLAAGLGADPLHVLLETPVGLVCLVVGLGLDGLGLLWTGRLVARAGGTG